MNTDTQSRSFFSDVYTPDIHTEKNTHPIYCYRTGTHVYEEQFALSRLTAAGHNAAGYTLNILENGPTRFHPGIFGNAQSFRFTVDGVTLDSGWRTEDFTTEKRPDGSHGLELTHAALTLVNDEYGISVTVNTVLDGTNVITRSLTLKNLSSKTRNIGNITVLGGLLEHTDNYSSYLRSHSLDTLYDLGYFEFTQWGHEGAFRFHRLDTSVHLVTGRYGNDRFRHPFCFLRNNATGALWNFQFGWSAGYSFDFDLRFTSDATVDLFYSIRTDGFEPFLTMAPGDTYTSPSVHLGMIFGSFDDSINDMHTHMRRSVFTLPAARGIDGGLVEAGMGPERIMDIAATKHFADTAALVGAETLIIDAGWYCPVGHEGAEWHMRAGDWVPDAGRYPNGISEIRDYIHSKGLLFGLWLDLERIGSASKLFADHPDWAMTNCFGNKTSLLDMGNPSVTEWVEAELSRVITEYGVELFRLDYNVGIDDINAPIYPNGVRESCPARYYKAVYAMYERLRRRFPDVVFENCAGGGGRTDIGHLANFTHTWVSDWQIAPRSAVITNGMTMALPPERVDRLVSGMGSHERGSLEFMTRQTIFGRPTTNSYNCLGSESNPEQINFVRHTFDIYKKHIRPYAADGLVFHHTPEIYGEFPKGEMIIERASCDRSHSVIGVFRLADASESADKPVTVYPRGIDAGKTYTLIYDNRGGKGASVSGYELMNTEIRVPLGGALTSELIILEAED